MGNLFFIVFELFVCILYKCVYQYHLFNNPKCFETSSIVIILIYLLFELVITFYIVHRLYRYKY
jgi:hypothetical protein